MSGMNPAVKRLIELLALPPTSLYIGITLGLCLYAAAKRRAEPRRVLARMGAALALCSSLTLVALSIPQVAFWLLDSLQTAPAIPFTATSIDADAIVVLGGDIDCDPPEYGPDQPGFISLERCRYAAQLSRRTGVPILISGGVLRPDRRSAAEVLRDFVQDELQVPVRWVEKRALNTRQNIQFSAQILRKEGIQRMAVVTHAWHMPRALDVCESEGLTSDGWTVLAAPTMAATPPANLRDAIMPRARSFRDSSWAIHEWVGRLWYRLST